jgi:hypothetical protein
MSQDEKPFDASFGASERYRPAHGDDARTSVTVDGVVCQGEILGRNGPRAQVRFVLDDATYVRWFDLADLIDDPSPGT